MTQNAPIGIFDSGVGGLTVANAIISQMPGEKIIYIGDTAHLPYGDKSSELIQNYSVKISDFLVRKKCKVIVIACNTASAYGYSAVKEHIKKTAPDVTIIDVITPVADYISLENKFKKIGIIGTKGTINSGAYLKQINERVVEQVVQLATPLFAYMIEEGFIYDDISNAIIRSYLSNEKLKGIDALVLGCTHYPIIKNQIRKFYNFHTTVIDSSKIVALHLKKILQEASLLNMLQSPVHEFYVTDYTDFFKHIAEMFFEIEINLKKININD